ncbi:MAG: CRISPR-associated endonuclease Cas2 [Blastocatellia bacterium]|nr:CRISPR-associated endonuclease Cas2 [Blastocatellia bacterium]
MESKHWYVICYDIADSKRWRKVFKLVNGYGWSLQYSVFRCRLTTKELEKLRWEIEKILTQEDRLLIIPLCDSCEKRVATHNRPESWTKNEKSFDVV